MYFFRKCNFLKLFLFLVLISFSCNKTSTIPELSGDEIQDVDGNVYKIVKIGDQWWMAENLKVVHYRNGDPIPKVSGDLEWSSTLEGAYCHYEPNSPDVNTYGLLYNWYAVNDIRGLAPEGWHVPTDQEWKVLESYLGMTQGEVDDDGWRGTNEGGKLKENGSEHWEEPNEGATNESGFTALPAGFRNEGWFLGLWGAAYFWTSTQYVGTYAWYRTLGWNFNKISRYKYGDWNDGMSIRCVKDD